MIVPIIEQVPKKQLFKGRAAEGGKQLTFLSTGKLYSLLGGLSYIRDGSED